MPRLKATNEPLLNGCPPPPSPGPYQIIYADPPWSYRDPAQAGRRGAACKYPVMDLAAIAALPVPTLAANDCVLFLWVTLPLLPEGLRVIDAWGFDYKTTAFVWIKTNPCAGTDFFGMGHWTRANAELCLLATRGRPARLSARVRQVIRSPILRHSEKPGEARERIVALLGDLPRVELFARAKTPGWDCWGNEVDSDVAFAA